MSRASRERHALEAAKQAADAQKPQEPLALEQPGDTAETYQPPKLDNTRDLAMQGLYEGRQKAAAKITDPKDMPPGLPPQEPAEDPAEAEAIKKAEQARQAAEKKAADAAKQQKPVEKPKEEPETIEAEATPAEEPAPTTSKQKVDGVEYDVALAEIEEAGGERAWRINKANENRLAKTNEALAETRKIQAAIAQWAQSQAPKTPVVTDDEFIKGKMDLIRFGTPEEGSVALREILARAVPKIDQNAIIMQATINIKRDMARATFRKENSDIFANPMISKLADQIEVESIGPYVQQGQINWNGVSQLDWSDFYSTIGNQVRSVMGPRPSQPHPAPAAKEGASGNPSQLSEKEVRKASIVNLPTAAAARAEAPKEEKPETREEALNRMKRSRGIPTG